MAFKLRVTASAERDLNDILTYIITDLDNMDAAVALADEIERKYSKLEENPLLYEECRDPKLKLLGYRKVTVGGYLLIYRIDSDIVYIERFFSQLQNYADKI